MIDITGRAGDLRCIEGYISTHKSAFLWLVSTVGDAHCMIRHKGALDMNTMAVNSTSVLQPSWPIKGASRSRSNQRDRVDGV